MTQAVKRACDACHRRKVKCDGINPCRNCSSAQLACTYNAIPQKKGPKGSRAKVISELRETQRQTSLTAKVHNRINGIQGPPDPAGGAPTPGMLASDLIKECVEFYFNNLYEKAPILDRRQLDQQVPFVEKNRDAYCLLASLCAFVMLQPGMALPLSDAYGLEMVPGSTIVASQLLLEECLRVRKGYEYLDNPSLNTLATSFFVLACHQALELHDKAWFYLREATTMIHMNGMNKEETYSQWEATESSRRRRLYWLLFVLERAHAIQRQRPLTLQATIQPPSTGDDPSDPQARDLASFVMLVKLFHSFDDPFTGVWSKTRGNLSHQHTSSLQKQFNESLPTFHCQDGQLADLSSNQQWLKTTHWQLTNGTIASHNDDGINWQTPRDLSRELLMKFASQFPGQGMELLSSGLIEKLFDICSNITDFLNAQPASRDPFSTGPREHLSQILNMFGALRHGSHHFLPLLFSKVNEILPKLTNPMLHNVPESCGLANIDIFDGFGNAGMAQPPQMSMQMDTDYDRKFSVADYEKSFGEMSGTSSDTSNQTPPSISTIQTGSTADMSSPFVSSPTVMSPGMEFPRQNLNDFCSPMSEMVMSPIGPGPGSSINGPGSIGGQHQHQEQQQQQQHHHQHHHQSHHVLQNQYMNSQQVPPNMAQHDHNVMQQGQALNVFAASPGPSQPGMNTASMPGGHPASQAMNTTGNGMMGTVRQAPQRTNSFVMPQQTQIPRTVGDFHALQRSNTGDLGSLSGMGTEMDFNAMR